MSIDMVRCLGGIRLDDASDDEMEKESGGRKGLIVAIDRLEARLGLRHGSVLIGGPAR